VSFISPDHLSRLFREHFGIGFQAYLQTLRLEKAEELPNKITRPVAQIARLVGYRDVSRFGQHFPPPIRKNSSKMAHGKKILTHLEKEPDGEIRESPVWSTTSA
jgi:transcriptional regulator GlxA family with amidase domain